MSGLISLVGLMLRVVAGFAVAVILSGLVFATLLFFAMPDFAQSGDTAFDLAAGVLLMALFVGAAAGMLTAVPVFVAIVVSEWRGLNGLVFHVGTGALIGLCAVALWASRNVHVTEPALAAGVVAGAAGAGAYWLISGRRAGQTFDRIAEDRMARRALTPPAQKEP